jgi:hypothetical protein
MEKELLASLKEEGILMQVTTALWYEKKLRAHQANLILTKRSLVLERKPNMFLHMFGILGALLPFLVKSFRAKVIFNILNTEVKSVELEKFFRGQRLVILLKDDKTYNIIVGNKLKSEEWKAAIEKNIKSLHTAFRKE